MNKKEFLVRRIKRAFIIWWPLALILLPLIIVIIIQTTRFANQSILSQIAENIYNKVDWIRGLCDLGIIPYFSLSTGINLSDVLSLVFIICWITCVIFAGNVWRDLSRYSRLKRELEDDGIKKNW